MIAMGMKRKLMALTSFLFLLPLNAIAQVTSDKHEMSFVAALVRTGAALLLVLALIFFTVYLLKKYLPSLTGNALMMGDFKKDKIEILSSRSLGPKKSLHIISVEGRRFLIASTESSITMLEELKAESDTPHPDKNDDSLEELK